MLEPAGRLLAEEHGVLFAPGVIVDGQLVTYGRPSDDACAARSIDDQRG